MMNADITTKSAYKLLQQLESDPQLQSTSSTTCGLTHTGFTGKIIFLGAK
jgi:hypothetical protein